MTLDRRRFLQVTAAGMVASLTSSGCDRDSARVLARPQLLEMLGPERVWEIGSRYRTTVPNENTEAALQSAITGSRDQGFTVSSLWRDPIEQQIRDDFAAGRTVIVNGWVLSTTEARQSALFSLAPV
jgi:hypothetical protein